MGAQDWTISWFKSLQIFQGAGKYEHGSQWVKGTDTFLIGLSDHMNHQSLFYKQLSTFDW